MMTKLNVLYNVEFTCAKCDQVFDYAVKAYGFGIGIELNNGPLFCKECIRNWHKKSLFYATENVDNVV